MISESRDLRVFSLGQRSEIHVKLGYLKDNKFRPRLFIILRSSKFTVLPWAKIR